MNGLKKLFNIKDDHQCMNKEVIVIIGVYSIINWLMLFSLNKSSSVIDRIFSTTIFFIVNISLIFFMLGSILDIIFLLGKEGKCEKNKDIKKINYICNFIFIFITWAVEIYFLFSNESYIKMLIVISFFLWIFLCIIIIFFFFLEKKIKFIIMESLKVICIYISSLGLVYFFIVNTFELPNKRLYYGLIFITTYILNILVSKISKNSSNNNIYNAQSKKSIRTFSQLFIIIIFYIVIILMKEQVDTINIDIDALLDVLNVYTLIILLVDKGKEFIQSM